MSYVNPVYPHSFPDPFVMKHQGGYWGYCTGFWQDGRCFGVLHSTDLVHWQALPAAMDPLPGEANCYWAPEVVCRDGSFYMYYSVGDGIEMHIRVAVAEHPAGLCRKVSRIRIAVTPLDSYELVVNVRLDEITGRQGYGLYPALAKMDAWDGLLCLERGAKEWVLAWRYLGEQARLLLPEGFDPFRYQQFRLLKLEDQLNVRLVGPWGTSAVGAVYAPSGRCQVGLYVHPGARAAFEMVRVTAIP